MCNAYYVLCCALCVFVCVCVCVGGGGGGGVNFLLLKTFVKKPAERAFFNIKKGEVIL